MTTRSFTTGMGSPPRGSRHHGVYAFGQCPGQTAVIAVVVFGPHRWNTQTGQRKRHGQLCLDAVSPARYRGCSCCDQS